MILRKLLERLEDADTRRVRCQSCMCLFRRSASSRRKNPRRVLGGAIVDDSAVEEVHVLADNPIKVAEQ